MTGIFERKSAEHNRLDCNAMLTAVHYKSLLHVLGPDLFNAVVAEANLTLHGFKTEWQTTDQHLLAAGFYERVDVPVDMNDPTRFLVPGDRVYFQNHPLMRYCDPENVWGGEHALYVEDGKFTGFGIGPAVPYRKLLEKLLTYARDACEKKGDPKATEMLNFFEPRDVPGINIDLVGVARVYRLVSSKVHAAIFQKFRGRVGI